MTPSTFSSVCHDHPSSRPETSFLTPPPPPNRPNWRSRIFAPLTPIVASPLSTPVHSVSTRTLSLNEDDSRPSQNVERTSTSTASTPTWTSIPPTPPPNLIFRSKSVSVRPISSFVSPSTSLPDTTTDSVLSSSVEKKRRASLPPITVLKPLPPIPRSSSRRTSESSHKFTSDSVSRPHSQQSTENIASTVTPQARPVFHLAVDNSDRDDDSRPETLINTDSSEPDSAVVAIIPQLPLLHRSLSVGERESSRRYHALSELLSTELGYLVDLRTLVSVYLRLLPVLTNRGSYFAAHGSLSNSSLVHPSRSSVLHASHTLSASHRTQSHPQLNGSIHPPTVPFRPEGQVPTHASMYPLHGRGDRSAIRHLFSASDLDTITRNAEEVLEFHEMLVRKLRHVVSPFGLPMSLGDNRAENSGQSRRRSHEDVDRAINAVSTLFIDHASSFDQYQSFCSGHSEAFDLVRKVQQRYPTEWDAFEQRCIVVAAEMHLDASLRTPQEELLGEEADPSGPQTQAKRRHSLSSLDALSNGNAKAPNLSASESGHSTRETNSRRPRLMFMDYLIKPVQRVCRYPLLFDQLQERITSQRSSESSRDSSFAPSESDQDAVKTASRTMRIVASLVDEARQRQDLSAKSAQIVSRITQGLLTSTVSHSRLPQSSSLSTFLSSLPPCCLSGSLDVIHYRGTSMERLGTVKAKYLGGFLFPGGFLVLVKVAKSRAYEPKHWFNLRGFELTDSNNDDGLLPSWFRLSSKGHTFEFAASCRREKDVWVNAIRGAIAEEVPWSDEPPTSLQTIFGGEGSGLLLEDVPFDTISLLPTIQSIPELDNAESAAQAIGETAPPSIPALGHRPSQIIHRAESSTTSEFTPVAGPSHRSSVPAQSIPTSESSTFHLVRSTASAREQVDRGLLDVFSEKCLTARFHAHTHEEELFEAQKVTRSFSRSSSGLNMASAMGVAAKNRLTKRESVLVPRRKSYIDGNGMANDPESYTHLAMPKHMTRRRPPNKLKIVAMSKAVSYDGDEDVNELYVESPSPMSHCSSVSFATPVTPLSLPALMTDGTTSQSEFLDVRPKESVPKRSKSMIENFRGLFVPRSASPTTGLTQESSMRSSASNSRLLRWWSRESLRRRVRSAPDVRGEELPSALTTQSLNVSVASRPSLATSDRLYSQPDLQFLAPSPSEFGVEDPTPQKKGVSSSRGPRRRWTSSALSSAARDEGSMPTRARIRRNLSFMNRFTPVTPSTVSQHSGS